MGKVSTLTHFPLELGCENYSFLDQAVTDIEHGLDSILMDSINTQDLYTSMMSLMPLLLQSLQGSYVQLVPFLIPLNRSLLPAHNLTNYGYHTRVLLLLLNYQAKFWPLNVFLIFQTI